MYNVNMFNNHTNTCQSYDHDPFPGLQEKSRFGLPAVSNLKHSRSQHIDICWIEIGQSKFQAWYFKFKRNIIKICIKI